MVVARYAKKHLFYKANTTKFGLEERICGFFFFFLPLYFWKGSRNYRFKSILNQQADSEFEGKILTYTLDLIDFTEQKVLLEVKEQNKMVLFTISSETSDIELFSLLFMEEQDTPFHVSVNFSVAELITETE